MTVKLAGREIVQPMAWKSTRESSGAAAWRTQRPVLDAAKCTGCLLCWKFCPEPAILPADGKVAFELSSCKGCGVCAVECPADAIRMIEEAL